MFRNRFDVPTRCVANSDATLLACFEVDVIRPRAQLRDQLQLGGNCRIENFGRDLPRCGDYDGRGVDTRRYVFCLREVVDDLIRCMRCGDFKIWDEHVDSLESYNCVVHGGFWSI
jgi:hypothetical protein